MDWGFSGVPEFAPLVHPLSSISAAMAASQSPAALSWTTDHLAMDRPTSVQAAARRKDGGVVARQGIQICVYLSPCKTFRDPSVSSGGSLSSWTPLPAAHHPGSPITLSFALNIPLSDSSAWKALSSKHPCLFAYFYSSLKTQFIYHFLWENSLWPSYLLSLTPG